MEIRPSARGLGPAIRHRIGNARLAGAVGTERDGHGPDSAGAHLIGGAQTRMANAEMALSLASRGVRSSVVRLPPTVHGEGDHGFVATLIDIAAGKAVSGYIGDGSNRGLRFTASMPRPSSAWRWRRRRRIDAARRADEGVAIREIAEVIGRHLHLPVVAVSPDDAADHFAWLAGFLGADSPASSALTRQLVGWQPTHAGLLDDLDTKATTSASHLHDGGAPYCSRN